MTTALIGLYFGITAVYGHFPTPADCEAYAARARTEHVLGRIELRCVPIQTPPGDMK